MDINLEKSPSGTWERRKKRRFARFQPRLTRLRRLWVAAAVAWLALVAATGYLLMPSRGDAERTMVFAVTEEVRRYDGLAFVAESPGGIYEAARREGFDTWIAKVRAKHRIGPDADRDFARIRERYLRDLESLPNRQSALLFLLGLAWAGPMAALYAAVRVMEWIAGGGRG
jgi:hypothetical protein